MFVRSLNMNEPNIVNVMAPPMPTYAAQNEPAGHKKQVSFLALYRYAAPLDVFLMAVGMLAAIGSGIMIPMYVLSMGDIVDAFNYNDIFAASLNNSDSSSPSSSSPTPPGNNNFTSNVNENVYRLLYFGAINCVLQFLTNFVSNLSAQRQCNAMRRKFFENAMAQEVGWFDATQVGGLTTLATNIQQIQSGIGVPVCMIITTLSTLIGAFVVGFIKEWRMTLVIACVTPLILAAAGYLGGVIGGTFVKAYAAQEEAGKIAGEIISGIRTVTAFSIQGKALERYNEANKGVKQAGYAQGRAKGTMFGVVNFMTFSIYGLAFWYGSTLVTDGKLSPGTVITVFMSVTMGTSGLSMVSPTIGTILEARGAAYEIFKIIDRKSAIDPRSESGEMLDIRGNIEFKDVTFRYPTRPEAIVLKNFNLKIKKGRTVALVGSSGSGKSTIVGLLERFYDTEEGFGTVYVDGHDIKDLNLKHFRSQVGIVTQEPVLFATTIAQNIAYGYNGEATQEMIQAAAKEANAHNFIMKLPEGYNTLVGERGTQLSGGQKQRISIARALIRKPKILIFDEATSALDTESERIVQESIDKVAAGRTCIIIAHRLSTVRNVDCIVVIHKGAVVEKGNHDELMRLGGTYKSLVERQQIQGHDSSTPSEEKERSVIDNREREGEESGKCACNDEEVNEKARNEEEEAFERELGKQRFKLVLRSFGLLKDDALLFAASLIFSFLNGVWMPMQGLIMAEIMALLMYDPKYADILGMTQEEHDNRVIYWAIGYVALGVASFLFNFFQNTFLMMMAERLTHYIRYESFKAIMRQETGWFDDKSNMVGTLTTRLASDSAIVHTLTNMSTSLVMEIISSLGIGIVIAFVGCWKVALVVLATVPVNAAANFFQMRSLTNFGQKTREAYEQCGRVASESLENVRTVVSLGREKTFLGNYAKELAKPDEVFIESSLANAFGTAFNGLYQFWVAALAFWYGGTLIKKGETDFNGIMKAQLAITMGTQYLGSMASYFPSFGKAVSAINHIFQLLDRKPAIPSPTTVLPKTMKEDKNILSASKNEPIPHPKPTREDGKMYAKVTGKIEFRDVRFAYPTRPDQEILKGLSLVAKPRQTVALVGESGCGKSTTISLIERFYSPTGGQILLDGHPIESLEVEWLRSQIGLVSQEPTLFATSIRENIRYGKPDATDEEIIEAAKKSNAHTFITGFPDGYDTMVGEKGVSLSGGQKQRIAIARALVRNPKILLLDEATSALDAESECVVQEALDKAREGRTTITIAHRLSTIKDADVILVFEKGVIVEKGKHEELLELNGLYFNLVKAQTK